MWMERMIGVSKAENGFVIEVHIPFKKDKEMDSKKDMPEPYPGGCEKQFIARDASEVGTMVDKLMGMLDMEFKSEDDFDSAFKEAAGMKPAA